MAVYSQYNPATGQFEYFQGAPSAPQSSGDPAGWDWRYYGQADPASYADYWARPDGSLLADAMRMQAAYMAPAPQAPMQPADSFNGQLLPPELRYLRPQAPHYVTPAERMLGGVADAVAGDYGYPARFARWVGDTGRRASEAQDWVEGIY